MIFTLSCSYKYDFIKDDNGKRFFVREYSDSEEETKYNEKRIFKKYYPQKEDYTKYNGSISSKVIDGWPYVIFDSVKVGFGPEARNYMSLFTSGLMSSKLIYCKFDSLCSPPSLDSKIDSVRGYVMNIGFIKEPEYLKVSAKKRRFKLWINPSVSSGGYGYHIFFIELQNRKVNDYVGFDEFVKDAKLTFVKSLWVEL